MFPGTLGFLSSSYISVALGPDVLRTNAFLFFHRPPEEIIVLKRRLCWAARGRVRGRANRSVAARISWNSVGPRNAPRRVIHAGPAVMAVTAGLGPARKFEIKSGHLALVISNSESIIEVANLVACLAGRNKISDRRVESTIRPEAIEFPRQPGSQFQSGPASITFARD